MLHSARKFKTPMLQFLNRVRLSHQQPRGAGWGGVDTLLQVAAVMLVCATGRAGAAIGRGCDNKVAAVSIWLPTRARLTHTHRGGPGGRWSVYHVSSVRVCMVLCCLLYRRSRKTRKRPRMSWSIASSSSSSRQQQCGKSGVTWLAGTTHTCVLVWSATAQEGVGCILLAHVEGGPVQCELRQQDGSQADGLCASGLVAAGAYVQLVDPIQAGGSCGLLGRKPFGPSKLG